MLSPESIQQVKDNLLLTTAQFVSEVNQEGFDVDFSTPLTIYPWHNGGHNISFERITWASATKRETRGVAVGLRRFQGLRIYVAPTATITVNGYNEQGRLTQTNARSSLLLGFEEKIRIVRKNEEIWEPEDLVRNQYVEALKKCWDKVQACVLSEDKFLVVVK